jgi:beta-lactamase class D
MAEASKSQMPAHRPGRGRVYVLVLLSAIKVMSKCLVCVLFVLFSGQIMADDVALVEVFARSGVEGTTVISSLIGEQTYIYNETRAHQRFSSASTFKIPNTLISLEERAISGKDDVFQWDGQIYEIPDWNHDQTLESAFKVSCVWCYQQLASQIGAERYLAHLHELGYGELSEPFSETTFPPI